MLRLFATIVKEFLVLSRDKSGMAILFIMPVALVTIMALIIGKYLNWKNNQDRSGS